MLRDLKNSITPIYLIVILLIVNLLSSCSGCSKSGRKIPANINKIDLVNSENNNLNNLQTKGIDTIINIANNIENENNNIISVGKDIYGIVFSIIDGDTYDLLIKGNKTIRIRMEGIDAPESGMPFYQVSKNYLGKLCFNKNVKVHVTGKDNNSRYLGFTYLDDGTELSHEMIKAGLAWHFKKYNTDIDLSNLEIDARIEKVGLWIDSNPMPPWVNRELHKKGISTKEYF